jgi:hypothetical protein
VLRIPALTGQQSGLIPDAVPADDRTAFRSKPDKGMTECRWITGKLATTKRRLDVGEEKVIHANDQRDPSALACFKSSVPED